MMLYDTIRYDTDLNIMLYSTAQINTLPCTGVREIGVIERYAAIISTLDESLEPREGDDFLGWLRSRSSDDVGSSPQSATASDSGSGGDGAMEGAKKRAELEAFLSAASARLNALVAGKEEALFGDRGEEAVEGKGEGVEEEKGAATATAVSPNMSDDDLYQVWCEGARDRGASLS